MWHNTKLIPWHGTKQIVMPLDNLHSIMGRVLNFHNIYFTITPFDLQ